MRVRIFDEALDEYASAAEYYETQEAGLGQRFDADVNHTLANALGSRTPDRRWSLPIRVSKSVRSCSPRSRSG